MVVKSHGPFVRGANLCEAFFYLNLVNHSADILLHLGLLGIIHPWPGEARFPRMGEYRRPDDIRDVIDPVLLHQFRRAAYDVFHLKLSPFHTGSLSVQDGREMLITPALSVPEDMPFDIRRLPVDLDGDDYFESLHRAVYRYSNAKAALFTLSPEAMVQSFRSLVRGEDRIIPMDAEGGYLYPAVPVVAPDESLKRIVEKAVRYKMVAIAGLGVLAIGHTPGHTIHHNSSMKNICYFRTQLEIMQKLGKIPDFDRYLCEKGKTW
jgi:ribulose-5-phosphate 4-epimerase/fuculose-1-phosphate aldolase